ncbi:MAG TPA: hypothetical protein VJP77_03570, partial [Planctomycetota bacterium]|nr:hypothetical protein [Planctomycetota bacterium]
MVLGCATSAALHKGVDLASKLTQAGHAVRAVLTPRAAELVSPQLFEAVTGERGPRRPSGARARGRPRDDGVAGARSRHAAPARPGDEPEHA